mmetsp:Transcript_43713/g.71053  ORF Transcript_43713/g.71053 Transcript_43713/m.71053 type:complete len:278 (-) Transcript_43713:868-1701(-)
MSDYRVTTTIILAPPSGERLYVIWYPLFCWNDYHRRLSRLEGPLDVSSLSLYRLDEDLVRGLSRDGEREEARRLFGERDGERFRGERERERFRGDGELFFFSSLDLDLDRDRPRDLDRDRSLLRLLLLPLGDSPPRFLSRDVLLLRPLVRFLGDFERDRFLSGDGALRFGDNIFPDDDKDETRSWRSLDRLLRSGLREDLLLSDAGGDEECFFLIAVAAVVVVAVRFFSSSSSSFPLSAPDFRFVAVASLLVFFFGASATSASFSFSSSFATSCSFP